MTDWKTTLRLQQTGNWGTPVKQDGSVEAKIASLIRARNAEQDGELQYAMRNNISEMLKELNISFDDVDDELVWKHIRRDE